MDLYQSAATTVHVSDQMMPSLGRGNPSKLVTGSSDRTLITFGNFLIFRRDKMSHVHLEHFLLQTGICHFLKELWFF